MRWLFIFLIFINLFFAIWAGLQNTSSQSIQSNREKVTNQQIHSISLLSEHPEQAQKSNLQIQTISNTETIKDPY